MERSRASPDAIDGAREENGDAQGPTAALAPSPDDVRTRKRRAPPKKKRKSSGRSKRARRRSCNGSAAATRTTRTAGHSEGARKTPHPVRGEERSTSPCFPAGDLPNELQCAVLAIATAGDEAAGAACRFVCTTWRSLLGPGPADGGTVAQHAAARGALTLLRWARANGAPWDARTCTAAAAGGHLKVLRWVRRHGCPWDPSVAAAEAAVAGRMPILSWIRDHVSTDQPVWDYGQQAIAAAAQAGRWDVVRGCHFVLDERVCMAAAREGRVAELRWALKRLRDSEIRSVSAATICAAAGAGRADIVRLLREEKVPWDATACEAAAAGGHTVLLAWLRERGCPWDARACTAAALGGHAATLRWLREKDCPWTAGVCSEAARGEHPELLQWARANGCPWNPGDCFRSAALAGSADVLARLLSLPAESGEVADHGDANPRPADGNPTTYADLLLGARGAFGASRDDREERSQFPIDGGRPRWYHGVCAAAARGGHIDLVRWLRDRGFPWGPGVAAAVAAQGRLAELRRLLQEGCPWDFRVCARAAWNGHLDTLRWAIDNGAPFADVRVFCAAAVGGNVATLRLLHVRGCPWDATVCSAARKAKQVDALRWLRINGCPDAISALDC